MSDVKPTCYMCERPPKKMTATDREGMTYINAQYVVMFCSVRCAANYALLWGVPMIVSVEHFCPAKGEWFPLSGSECSHCRPVSSAGTSPADNS